MKERTERAVTGGATLTMGVTLEANTIWNGLEMAQWLNPDGSVAKTFYDSGETGANAEQTLIYAKDHLGTVRGWYRLSDGAKGYAHYGVYGNLTSVGFPNNSGDMPIRGYTGHYLHRLSGLLLAPYRAYDPTLCRWLSEDPIAEAGGPNLYAYVGNGPITYFDPLGLNPGAGAAVLPVLEGVGIGISSAAAALPGLVAVAVVVWTPTGQEWIGDNIGTPIADWFYPDLADNPMPTRCDSRANGKGERGKERKNPNPNKKKRRDHQDGKKLPDKPKAPPRNLNRKLSVKVKISKV